MILSIFNRFLEPPVKMVDKFDSARIMKLIRKPIDIIIWMISSTKKTVIGFWRFVRLFAMIPWRIAYEVLDNFIPLRKAELAPFSLTKLDLGLLPVADRKMVLRQAVETWWAPEAKSINATGLRALAEVLAPLVSKTYLENVLGRSSKTGWNTDSRTPLLGAKILDMNCGVGYLTELLASQGADVTGTSTDSGAVMIARAHWKRGANNSNRPNYLFTSVKDFERQNEMKNDVVICSEFLDHVDNPAEVIAACCKLVRQDGCIIFTVPNRTWTALFVEIIGLEHVVGLAEYGTHSWRRYMKPNKILSITKRYGFTSVKQFGLNPVWTPRKKTHWRISNYDGLWFALVVKKTLED